jgi:uncharacterized protein (DUF362 family)
MERRRFLKQGLKYGAGIAALWGLGWSFADFSGPGATDPVEKEIAGPFDWSPDEDPPQVAVAQGTDRGAALAAALAALGGMKRFVGPEDRVFIKVNAAFASPPALGATTHPDLLAALIRECRQAGARKILVSDNPINDPVSCFRLSGIEGAVREAGAELFVPGPRDFQNASLPEGRLLRSWPMLTRAFAPATKVINVAPVKHHHRAGASMILKNWYGLLGGPRNVFHQDVHTVIGELAALFRPTLAVLDGVTAMVTNGPTGGSLSDLKDTRTLIVSTDPVAADVLGAALLGMDPDRLPYLALAEAAGAGTRNPDRWRLHRVRAA